MSHDHSSGCVHMRVTSDTYLEISFFWRILDYGHNQLVMVTEVGLATPPSYPFDHLLVCDAELPPWVQQCCHDSSFGVCVDNRTSVCRGRSKSGRKNGEGRGGERG